MKVGLTVVHTIPRALRYRSFRPPPLRIPPLVGHQPHRSFVRPVPNPVITMEGKLHIYHSKRRLNLLEYTGSPSPSKPHDVAKNNILLFVGGMFDNFRGTGYVDELADALQNSPWRVCHVQLSSASRSFGTFDLKRDVDELETCVKFIRSNSGLGNADTKIVLLGHSTGCQDTLTYIYSQTKSPRPSLQGAILQAAASDREGAMHCVSSKPEIKSLYDQCMDVVLTTPAEHHKTTVLPMHWTTPIFGPAPMSISRFLSLVSPGSPSDPSADDLFSSDIPDSVLATTFGKVGSESSPLQPLPSSQKRSLMVLLSGADEYMPTFIDKDELLSRWKKAIESDNGKLHLQSQVIKNGLHDLSGLTKEQEHARQVVFREAVLAYLDDVLGSDASKESHASALEKGVAGMKL